MRWKQRILAHERQRRRDSILSWRGVRDTARVRRPKGEGESMRAMRLARVLGSGPSIHEDRLRTVRVGSLRWRIPLRRGRCPQTSRGAATHHRTSEDRAPTDVLARRACCRRQQAWSLPREVVFGGPPTLGAEGHGRGHSSATAVSGFAGTRSKHKGERVRATESVASNVVPRGFGKGR